MMKAVILDWAGTTIDFGCFGPVIAFIEAFKKRGIEISPDDARGPMGTHKREHLKQIAALPHVQKQFIDINKRRLTEADVDDMFNEFVPVQLACLEQHAELIPGALKAIVEFRKRGLKIGTTTGYTRQMMEVVAPIAKGQGFEPDALVCANDVSAGRPAPWMCFQNAMQLNIFPMASMVKIGDTGVDIEEGLNAGMWTIGIAQTGNEVGLKEHELSSLSEEKRRQKINKARDVLSSAGAHYVVDALVDAPVLVDEIEARLASGEKP